MDNHLSTAWQHKPSKPKLKSTGTESFAHRPPRPGHASLGAKDLGTGHDKIDHQIFCKPIFQKIRFSTNTQYSTGGGTYS